MVDAGFHDKQIQCLYMTYFMKELPR